MHKTEIKPLDVVNVLNHSTGNCFPALPEVLGGNLKSKYYFNGDIICNNALLWKVSTKAHALLGTEKRNTRFS